MAFDTYIVRQILYGSQSLQFASCRTTTSFFNGRGKMETKLKILTTLVIILAGGPILLAQEGDIVSIMAVVPKTLYVGAPATVSVTAFTTADRLGAVVPVGVCLKVDTDTSLKLFEGITDSGGRLTARFDVPDVPPGTYTLQVGAGGTNSVLSGQVQIRKMPVLLIETDKPIYKPGQTIKGRVLVLTSKLRPVSDDVSVEITDGKGVKIFRKSLSANAFGVAPFELDLASELNYGTWKITAESGSASSMIDVRVEQYVLPRFEVELLTERDYFLVDEDISGTINAHYFFGKPVDGTVEVRASRYIGVWEEYASYTAALSDGGADFLLPAVGYVAGTPGGGGAGVAQLEVVVTDTSGHEEKTAKVLKIVDSTIQHQLIAASRVIVPGQPFDVLLVAENQEGHPVTVSAEVTCECFTEYWERLSEERRILPGFNGTATVSFTAPQKAAFALVRSEVRGEDATADAELTIHAAYSPTDSFLHLRRASDEPVDV